LRLFGLRLAEFVKKRALTPHMKVTTSLKIANMWRNESEKGRTRTRYTNFITVIWRNIAI
jgi:hypothetical protein